MMKSRITPHFQDLISDAALKSFWRKKSLRKFLRNCGIAESFLSTWASDETKRDFLDRLFAELPRNDKGRACLVGMAKFLAEQKAFPDLENWEDSSLKIKNAEAAVRQLRTYCEKQEDQLESDARAKLIREENKKRQQETLQTKLNLNKLSDKLTELSKRIGSQEAGYEFQRWFYDLLDYSEIQNRRPYIHEGRQIDGSLTLSGTTYLVELKFTSDQADAPDVDVFRRKVTSKADNTMGVMVSISGFSSIAKSAGSGERTPVLLMDHSHLYLVLQEIMSMEEVIERIRRYASQTGESFLNASDFSR